MKSIVTVYHTTSVMEEAEEA
jgi:hypothetical protein